MARQQTYPSLEALRRLEASLPVHLCARAAEHAAPPHDEVSEPDAAPSQPASKFRMRGAASYAACDWRMRLMLWWPRLRKLAFVGATLGSVVLGGMSVLWWRLSSGPIELDMATPWLATAIKENFGSGHEVEIGGTQLERDANGRTSLRIRDIVVRDAEGTIVASAPKAEVGVSGSGLLTGRIRAERLSLVGAEMAVRIETDSKVTVFAGSNGGKGTYVTASASSTPVIRGATVNL